MHEDNKTLGRMSNMHKPEHFPVNFSEINNTITVV
jgi:hypothetical protein